jgi:hypothetical protein
MANEGHSIVGVNECHFIKGPEICTDIRLETCNRNPPLVMIEIHYWNRIPKVAISQFRMSLKILKILFTSRHANFEIYKTRITVKSGKETFCNLPIFSQIGHTTFTHMIIPHIFLNSILTMCAHV